MERKTHGIYDQTRDLSAENIDTEFPKPPETHVGELCESIFERLMQEAQDEKDRPVCILVLDGGGLRGTLSCEILLGIENALRDVSGDPNKKIADVFDLIMGTSTGGLLSLGLGYFQWDVKKCSELYDVMADKVFGGIPKDDVFSKAWSTGKWITDTAYDTISGFFGTTFSRYSSETFRKNLLDYFPDSTQLLIPKEEYLKKDSKRPFVNVVVTVENNSELAYPALLRSYTLGGTLVHEYPKFYPGTCKVKLIDAALATSAAPSYFDPVVIEVDGVLGKPKTNHRLVDGGLNANTPVIMAMCESYSIWRNRKVFIVSIGTGQPKIDVTKVNNGGFHAMTNLVQDSFNSLFSAKESAHMQTIALLSNFGFIDCSRWNAIIDPKKTAMDNPGLVKYWRETGQKYIEAKNASLKSLAQVLLECSKINIINEANI